MHTSPSSAFDLLPRFPTSIARALRHVLDAELSPDSIQRLLAVGRDLSAGLVRAANQRLFMPRVEIQSVGQAIASLGREGFHDLLFTRAVLSLIRTAVPALDPAVLRLHSVACAFLARELAGKLRIAPPAVAYRAGLVHDIGLVALGMLARHASSRALARAAQGGGSLSASEKIILGRDHCVYGQGYGEHLDLEADAIGAIRFHHDPAEAPAPRSLPALIGVCDHLARASGYGYGFQETLGSVYDTPSWKILREEKDQLSGPDPLAPLRDVFERLPETREAAAVFFEETVLA